jgi:hypothetical protein
MIKRNDYGCVDVDEHFRSVLCCHLHSLWFGETTISLFLLPIDITESFSQSLSLPFFLLWCTTTIIGGWQQTTTVRAIRRRHRRWFCRLIIIALSRSGPLFLRSLTLLLLPSSRRLQCSDRTTLTTSPSFDIHESYQFLYFSLKNKKPRANIFSNWDNVEFPYNYQWLSIGQYLFFFILIQQQV